jgi:isoleucyl-tRNA synthetase
VSDPSVFIKFKAADGEEYFLVWTTTPWTLISNAALAVGKGHDYVKVRHGDDTLILAEARLGVLDGDYEVVDRFKGAELEGRSYVPLFDFFAGTEGAFQIVQGEFVSLEDGTGIVHIAPAFGEDDYRLHLEKGVPVLQPVLPNGTFDDTVTPWAGQWIKAADPSITKHLKDNGLLYAKSEVTHSYPFCWRCKTALIYYARRSWYIKTTEFKDQLLEVNRKINWIPAEVGEYRMGNWLENNVDWALSRERYWGTPLPVWRCGDCGEVQAVGSIEELKEKCTNLPADESLLDLHRPFVDGLILSCGTCGKDTHRVSEVIDVWFDSGSMPFAQYHYPFEDNGMFEKQFPAEYISEGMDQTRGWFYSLLAISTFLKGECSFKNVLTTEMILDKQGQKMSKSRGNTVNPQDLLDKEGADALRWYLLTTSPPWLPTKFDRKAVMELSQKLLGTLRNVYSFFAMYAELDGYQAGQGGGEPNLLDRWILSRFQSVIGRVTELLDGYDMTRAARLLQGFILDELSNWYIRRSRRRFWKGELGPDKIAAYDTLYTVLMGSIKLLAPFIPFLTEEIYQAFRTAMTELGEDADSVHLTQFPVPDPALADEALETNMDTAIKIAGLGRTVRNEAGIKIRQPLSEILVSDESGRVAQLAGSPEIVALVLDELHVKKLTVAGDIGATLRLRAVPAYPVLGKRFGKRVPAVVAALNALGQEELTGFFKTGSVTLAVEGEKATLSREDAAVNIEGIEGYGAKEEYGTVAVLNLVIDEALRLEGLAREIVNRIQNLRKKSGFDVTDRIHLRYEGGPEASAVFDGQADFIKSETLAISVEGGDPDPAEKGWEPKIELDAGDEKVHLWVRRETD